MFTGRFVCEIIYRLEMLVTQSPPVLHYLTHGKKTHLLNQGFPDLIPYIVNIFRLFKQESCSMVLSPNSGMNPSFQIIYTNTCCLSSLGWMRRQCIGKVWLELLEFPLHHPRDALQSACLQIAVTTYQSPSNCCLTFTPTINVTPQLLVCLIHNCDSFQ